MYTIHCTKTVLYKDMIITEIFYYIAIRALLSISGTNVAPHITTLTKPLNRPLTLDVCEKNEQAKNCNTTNRTGQYGIQAPYGCHSLTERV